MAIFQEVNVNVNGIDFPAVKEDRFRIYCGKVIQILLSVCGLLIFLSHGLMIGWPCHYFARTFRDPDPFIDIPFNVAPLLAGSLLMGDILGTIISYFSRPNAKYAMVVGAGTMTLGWAVLWQSQNINWYFASRAFIGLGMGLTTLNLRTYIEHICDPEFSQVLTKLNPIFVYLGVILSTVMGNYDIDIHTFGFYAVIYTLAVVCLCMVIPQTPRALHQFGEVALANWLQRSLNPNVTFDEYLAIVDSKRGDMTGCAIMWTDLLVKSELRLKFLALFVLCFLQQFTGMPPTIIFGEFIYEKFEVPNPSRVTIFYTIVLFTVYSFGNFLTISNKKTCMMISSTLVCVTFLVLISLYHFNITAVYPTAVIVCMFLYIVFHTFGLGCLTSQVCIEMFPPMYRLIVLHFIAIFNAMWTIIVGKTFQVLFSQFHLYGPFTLYTIISGVAVLFIGLFIKNNKNNN